MGEYGQNKRSPECPRGKQQKKGYEGGRGPPRMRKVSTEEKLEREQRRIERQQRQFEKKQLQQQQQQPQDYYSNNNGSQQQQQQQFQQQQQQQQQQQPQRLNNNTALHVDTGLPQPQRQQQQQYKQQLSTQIPKLPNPEKQLFSPRKQQHVVQQSTTTILPSNQPYQPYQQELNSFRQTIPRATATTGRRTTSSSTAPIIDSYAQEYNNTKVSPGRGVAAQKINLYPTTLSSYNGKNGSG